jgi:hypothetical protein
MTPQRRTIIGNQTIAEYYWNGAMVVYVDNRRSTKSYNDAVQEATNAEAHERAMIEPERLPGWSPAP